MASVIILIRAPRYKDLSFEDIRKIQSFWSWRREVRNKSKYAANTFEEWCGMGEEELPPRDAILYYRKFFERARIDLDGIDNYRCDGIFEQVARISKASQFICWIMRNVIGSDKIPIDGAYEIRKEHIEQLLEVCNQTRRYSIQCQESQMDSNGIWRNNYKINAEIAQKLLPIQQKNGKLLFPYSYDTLYGEQVVAGIKALNQILASTNFDTQTIYIKFE